MNYFREIAVISIAVVVLIATSCGVVEKLANRAPLIKKVIASPDTVLVGNIVVLSVEAIDEDGDDMSFAFSADAGLFKNQDESTVQWQAPQKEGVYDLEITVRDVNEGETTQTIQIVVLSDSSPTVLITRPVDGSTLVGLGSTSIEANVTPQSFINRVVFYVNDDSIGVDRHYPYTQDWNLDGLSGAIKVKCIAYRIGTFVIKGADSIYVNVSGVIPVPQL